MSSSALAVRLGPALETALGVSARLRSLRLGAIELVGWPESANPAVSEVELAMLQPASSRDASAGTRTRYITRYMTLLSRRKDTGFTAENGVNSLTAR